MGGRGDIITDVIDKLNEIKDQADDLVSDVELAEVEVRIEFEAVEPVINIDMGLGGDHTVNMSDAIADFDDDDFTRLIAWLEANR